MDCFKPGDLIQYKFGCSPMINAFGENVNDIGILLEFNEDTREVLIYFLKIKKYQRDRVAYIDKVN